MSYAKLAIEKSFKDSQGTMEATSRIETLAGLKYTDTNNVERHRYLSFDSER